MTGSTHLLSRHSKKGSHKTGTAASGTRHIAHTVRCSPFTNLALLRPSSDSQDRPGTALDIAVILLPGNTHGSRLTQTIQCWRLCKKPRQMNHVNTHGSSPNFKRPNCITNNIYTISKSSGLWFLNKSSSLQFFLSKKRKRQATHTNTRSPPHTQTRRLWTGPGPFSAWKSV